MNAPEKFFLPDIQATPDVRQLAIQQVGVRDVRSPITVMALNGETIHSVANWTMTVGLQAEQKGTHMSRFIELLERPRTPMSQESFQAMLLVMLDLLGSQTGRI